MPELMVGLDRLLEKGGDRLRSAGISEPRRQAQRLWRELNRTPGSPFELMDRHRLIDCPLAARYQAAIERYAAGEPLAHVTGWVGFRHLTLRCDSRALIPRPESEGLVDLLMARTRGGEIADVGTGGGCIALSLAAEGQFRKVVAIDCSASALALARLNRDLVGANGTVELIQGDLCAPLGSNQVDALVSNPPYLTSCEHAVLDAAVRDWEPALALVSGPDGLELTLRLLQEGLAVLRPGGWLALEVDFSRARKAAGLASALGWQDVTVHTDLFGRERYLLARRSEPR